MNNGRVNQIESPGLSGEFSNRNILYSPDNDTNNPQAIGNKAMSAKTESAYADNPEESIKGTFDNVGLKLDELNIPSPEAVPTPAPSDEPDSDKTTAKVAQNIARKIADSGSHLDELYKEYQEARNGGGQNE